MAIKMLNCFTLFSGSSGNCVYINADGEEILIDCGRNAKTIETALCSLGSSLSKIKAIFITHEHIDHTAALEVISKKYHIPVHAAGPSAPYCGGANTAECMISHPPLFELDGGFYSVSSFITPHDSRMCVGYRITTRDGDIGVATDLGRVTDSVSEALTGCRGVVLESNHDIRMLMNGPYPASLKNRILSGEGHLSNDDCAECAAFLTRAGTESIMLAHISSDNNLPELALSATRRAVNGAGGGVAVSAASRYAITKLL